MGKTTTPKREYLSSAPSLLVKMHRERLVSVSHEILGRALTDPRMLRPWRELSRRVKSDDEWRRLWSEIVYILSIARQQQPRRKGAARRQPTRSAARAHYKRLATQARRLSDSMADGVLDVYAYEFFPAEVWAIFGVSDWAARDSLERTDAAFRLLSEWPTARELLNELRLRAEAAANHVAAAPRLIQRRTGPKLYFIRKLASYFKREFNTYLYGTLAAIVSTVLEASVTKEQVEKSLGPL